MESPTPTSCCKLGCFAVIYPEGLDPGRCQNGRALSLSWRFQHWWSTISLQRSACIAVCQGTLVQSSAPWVHPDSLLCLSVSTEQEDRWCRLLALLAVSRNAYCLEAPIVRLLPEQGWEQGWTCLFCCSCGSSVTKKDQISSKAITKDCVVSRPCICVC